ncbi:hypothetical protein ABZ128_31590 [Streptomyces sp. NPDC006326]|uniref:hypothetical protein n=1 Tax=Streptomyces sp. NPDC006326 TaxID=3156752 RepID=UPI0033BE8641
MNAKNALKRSLAALVLSGGAAVVLTPVAAHADDHTALTPLAHRVGEIADHPGSAVNDAKTAVAVTASAAGNATKATNSSLTGAGHSLHGNLPKAPKVR